MYARTGNRPARRFTASRNTSCPFQRANVATRPIRTRPASGGRPARSASGSPGPSGREGAAIDRVVDADERRRRPERGARVRQHALGVGDDRVGAPRQPAQQTHRQAAAADVIVQVPDETHPRGLDQRRGDVRLEAVGVHDGRAGVTDNRTQPSQVSRQRHGRCECLPCEAEPARNRTASLDRAALAQKGQRRRKRQLSHVEAQIAAAIGPAAPVPASRP